MSINRVNQLINKYPVEVMYYKDLFSRKVIFHLPLAV